MREILFVLIVVGFIAACSDTYSNSMSKAKQNYACSDHGGVYKYGSFFTKATCMDGERIEVSELKSVKLPPEYYPEKEN